MENNIVPQSEIKSINRNSYFSRKLIWISFIFSLMIICIHASNSKIYSFEQFGFGGEVLFNIEKLLNSLYAICVPSFFVISGYLLFLNYNIETILRKLKSRIFSLVIPYLIWNIIPVIEFAVLTNISYTANLLNTERITLDPINLVKAVLGGEYNVLWFVKVLIILVAVSPIIYFIIRNKYLAITSLIGVITINALVGNGKDTTIYSSIFFITGGILSIHYRKLFEKKKSFYISLLSLISLIVLVFAFWLFNIENYKIIKPLFLLAMVFAFWFSTDFVKRFSESPWWVGCSFFIYVIHDLILEPIEKIWLLVFGDNLLGATTDFFITPVIAFGVTIIMAYIMQNHMKRVYKICTGGR